MAVSMLDVIVIDYVATAQRCERAAVAAEPGPSGSPDPRKVLAYWVGGTSLCQLLSQPSLLCCNLLAVMNGPI